MVRSQTLISRGAATAFTLAALAAGAIAGATAAQAGTAGVTYSCAVPFLGTQTSTQDVTITAPDTATVGDTVTVTVESTPSQITSPIAIGEGLITGTQEIDLSGDQTGSFLVNSHQPSPAVAAGQSPDLDPYTGTLTLTTPGTVNLTPGPSTTVTDLSGLGLGKQTTTCTTTSTGVAATITVSPAS